MMQKIAEGRCSQRVNCHKQTFDLVKRRKDVEIETKIDEAAWVELYIMPRKEKTKNKGKIERET